VKKAAVGAALLAAGLAAALLSTQALGQVPVPTVSLPSVSLPLPVPPPPPAPPTPPPATPPVPPAPVPTPALPTPPSAPAPAPSAPAPSAPPGAVPSAPAHEAPAAPFAPSTDSGVGTASTGYYSADRRREPAGSSSPQRRARVTRLSASPKRIKPGSKRRAARITFRLTAPARVVFVVRGPAPSCDVVGRFIVRGRRGTNRVRFTGRVGRRTLKPGTYRLTARTAGRPDQTRRVVVILGDGPQERLRCPNPNQFVFLGATSFFRETPGSAAPRGAAKAPAPRAKKKAKEQDSRGVLPAIRKKIRQLPEVLPDVPPVPRPSVPGDGASPPAILGIAALGLLALSGIAILAYVIRYFRRPHAM
jgi:hypothetical protein